MSQNIHLLAFQIFIDYTLCSRSYAENKNGRNYSTMELTLNSINFINKLQCYKIDAVRNRLLSTMEAGQCHPLLANC